MASILDPIKKYKKLKNLLHLGPHKTTSRAACGLWVGQPWSMACLIHYFKKHSIWDELYCKEYSFALGNSGCNGWATELCNNRYLSPYKRIVVFPYRKHSHWLMHYAYVMYEHRSLSSLCIGLSGYCVWSCCVPDKLWCSSRSHRRCNNDFAFLRFLEFCGVAGNKSKCNLINFYCKLQLQLHKNKKYPLQLLENM